MGESESEWDKEREHRGAIEGNIIWATERGTSASEIKRESEGK